MTTTEDRDLADVDESPESPHQALDREWYGDDEVYELHQKLGLRPHRYSTTDEGMEQHPDQRPCPSWCSVRIYPDEMRHEISWSNPLVATHHPDWWLTGVASLYAGCSSKDEVQAASVEVHLSQFGQARPLLQVYLRQFPDGRTQKLDKLLKLSVTDARELAAMLTHMADMAERG